MRQLLADRVSGNLCGLWLLVAEHLRLGTWDLLQGWTRSGTGRVQPRLALQLVHEAAMCVTGVRAGRTLQTRGGFELASGLPFVASDPAIHELLNQHTVAESLGLQVALGKIRLASGHFSGKLLAIDPHRVRSFSRRHMRARVETGRSRPLKMAQTFWVLDAETCQPLCFTTGTAAQSVVDATPGLLDITQQILEPLREPALVVADSEHFAGELIADIHQRTGFDLLLPLPSNPNCRRRWQNLPEQEFTRRWAGFATAKMPYEIRHGKQNGKYFEFVERYGERRDEWRYQGFLCTSDRDEVQSLTQSFPQRWHLEEFFNANQALGWGRAGTMNINIRYGQMTMALIAQAVIHQLRERLGEPYSKWDAKHLAKDLFFGLDGDVRVSDNTITVTYYNAPNADLLRSHYEGLPEKLRKDNVRPEIPWLYGYNLNFRFC